MTDQQLVHYRVELPVGTPEQWATWGPGWTDLHIREGTSDVDVLHEVWIDDVYRLRGLDLTSSTFVDDDDVEQTVGKTVIDLGACTGIFSALALQFGVARVIAVEPEPANLELLRRNLQPWSAQGQVTIIEGAVSGRVERVGIIGEAGTAHTAPVFDDDTPSDAHIETVTLAQIIDDIDGPIALCKIDIEGSEYPTVLGCPSEQLARVERFVMETHGPEMCPWLDSAPVGQLVEHLLHTHGVEVFGYPNRGGMLIAHRYDQ